MLKKIVLVLSLIVITFSLTQCKKKEKMNGNTISYDSQFVEYIADYTSGTISKRSNITITLASVVDLEKIEINNNGIVADGVFTITPAVKGKVLWDSDKRIIFQPETLFESGKSYSVTLNLKKIYETVPENLSVFTFKFFVIKQDFEITVDDITFYTDNSNEYQTISGTIITSDNELSSDIESVVKGFPDIEWDHQTGTNTHKFIIRGFLRKAANYTVSVVYDGAKIGISKKGKIECDVFGLEGFNFIDYKLFTKGDKHVVVTFSNPLDKNQNLKGLITINESADVKTLVDNNKIKIFLNEMKENTVNITIDSSLKNYSGNQLSEKVTFAVVLKQEKPQIKFTDEKSGILAGGESFIIPFMAISLKAVDITVVEIFENNITQFFQSNSNIDGNDSINRVGKPILYKTVSLASKDINLYTWNTFNIDLNDYLKTKEGVFYQVRINFRRSQSMYTCDEIDKPIEDEMLKDNWDAPGEFSNWDYDYYYGDWNERDNPCSDSYYGKRREISKNILVSNIGIIAKGSDNLEYSFFVTNIKTTEPISNVDIELYDYQNQSIFSGKTDGDGIVKVTLDTVPFVAIAKNEKERSFIKIDSGSSLTLSRFDVGGTNAKRGVKGFLYADRGVWRPGDTIYLNFILLDRDKILPVNHPVIFELFDPDGKNLQKMVKNAGVGNIYSFTFKTDSEAVTGNYQAKIRVGSDVFTKRIKIETIKPNRLKIALDFGKDTLHYTDGGITSKMKVNYLHGAVARNMKTEVSVLYSPAQTTFKGFQGFTFDDPSKDFSPNEDIVYSGYLNDAGETGFMYNPKNITESSGMLLANFITRVMEDGGDFSTDKLVIPYYPYSNFAGIRLPAGDAARGMLLTDTDHNVEIVTVSSNGQSVSVKELEVSVYKLSWRWWWDTSVEEKSNFSSSSYSQRIAYSKVSTVNGKGSYSLRVNYPDWGRYFIKVYDPVSKHSTGQIFYIDWPGWAGAQRKGDQGGENLLAFYAEKEKYNVGDVAKFTIPVSSEGRALVNIESGNKSIESFWVKTNQGKTEFSVQIKNTMTPNIFVHVTLIQPHKRDNDLPIRLFGIVPISVVDEKTVLHPVLQIPNELAPEKEVKFVVSEKDGNAMAYTVAIVDEGLLSLTNFKTPDPWSSFFSKEAIGIKTWDMYDFVIGANTKIFGPMLTIGGDGEFLPPAAQKANRFEPVVRTFGPFYLKPNEKTTHSFVMPRYVGAVLTMVVAENKGAYGFAEKTSFVKESLMVLGTMPRVIGPDETIKLPVNVFMLEEGKRTVTVTIKTEGLLDIIGEKTKTIDFDSATDKFVYFDLKTPSKLGMAKVSIEALSNGIKSTYEVNIEVRASNPVVTKTSTIMVEPDEKKEIAINTIGLEGTNKIFLELSYLPPINLTKRLNYLIQYPHGCLEQTVSGVFPQLFIQDLTTVDAEQSLAIEKNINAGIDAIMKFRTGNGGFAYWPGNSNVSEWATNYAGHFLITAKEKGYTVSESLMNEWVDYQNSLANRWRDNADGEFDMIQAYRLYTLALYNKPAHSGMNRMKEKKNMDFRARWILSSAYAITGNVKIAEEIIKDINYTSDMYAESPETFGSADRDKAMILETLVLLQRKTEGFTLYKELAEVLGSDRWLSTQTTAYCLIAVSQLLSITAQDESVTAKYTFGKDSSVVNTQETYWNKELSAENNTLSIENTGKSTLFAKIVNQGIPLKHEEVAEEKNVSMIINYKNKEEQIITDISKLKQGSTIIVETTIKNTRLAGKIKDLALTQIVPSGWEIINTRLLDVDNFKAYSDFDYQNIRDDRVLTYFSLNPLETKTFRFMITASYTGEFYYPGVNLEAMYNDDVYSRKKGMTVSVVR